MLYEVITRELLCCSTFKMFQGRWVDPNSIFLNGGKTPKKANGCLVAEIGGPQEKI